MLAPADHFELELRVAAGPFVTAKAPPESVLRNLISNAIKHHDKAAGAVQVRIENKDRYCVFTVADDGPGIPKAAHERIFRMFQTQSSTPGGQSSVGLALAKRMAESHGGWIKVESNTDQRGTEFQVWWPRFQWSATA